MCCDDDWKSAPCPRWSMPTIMERTMSAVAGAIDVTSLEISTAMAPAAQWGHLRKLPPGSKHQARFSADLPRLSNPIRSYPPYEPPT
eukprot:scaffold19525_cov145-Skeletonema_marinoi.AAC.1